MFSDPLLRDYIHDSATVLTFIHTTRTLPYDYHRRYMGTVLSVLLSIISLTHHIVTTRTDYRVFDACSHPGLSLYRIMCFNTTDDSFEHTAKRYIYRMLVYLLAVR